MKKEPDIPEVSDQISCPYCEGPVEGMEAYCKKCQVEFEECWECSQPIKKDTEECPHCGATRVRV